MPNGRVSPGGEPDSEAPGSGLRRFATWKLALVGTAALLVVVGGGVGAGVALSGSAGPGTSDTLTATTTGVVDVQNQTTESPDGVNQTTEVPGDLNHTTEVPDDLSQTTTVLTGLNQTATDDSNQTATDGPNQTTVSSNDTSWNMTNTADDSANHTTRDDRSQSSTSTVGTTSNDNQTTVTTEGAASPGNPRVSTTTEDTGMTQQDQRTPGRPTSPTARAISTTSLPSTTDMADTTTTTAAPTTTVVIITPTPTASSACSGSADLANEPCALPIRYSNMPTSSHFADYRSWSAGDSYLDWNGKEPSQGTRGRDNREAEGSPTAWTTDVSGQNGYVPLNKYGQHHWYLDIIMDCSKSEGGWFDLKGYVARDSGGGFWEGSVQQEGSCAGTAGGNRPYNQGNHLARCGKINVFRFNEGSCVIDNY